MTFEMYVVLSLHITPLKEESENNISTKGSGCIMKLGEVVITVSD